MRRSSRDWAAWAVVLLVGASASGAATGDAAAATHRKRAPCTTEKGTTVAATSTARLYRRGSLDDATYYGCWLGTHRRTLLGDAYEVGDNSVDVALLTITGRYASFVQEGTVAEKSFADVSLVDLKTGKTVRKARGAVDPDATTPTVSGVVATTDGTLVWAGRAADCVGVHAVGPAGTRTLGCGAVGDLAATGRRAYWMQDGQPRTAVPSQP